MAVASWCRAVRKEVHVSCVKFMWVGLALEVLPPMRMRQYVSLETRGRSVEIASSLPFSLGCSARTLLATCFSHADRSANWVTLDPTSSSWLVGGFSAAS